MGDSQFHLPSSSFSKVPMSFDAVLGALENGFLAAGYPVVPIKEVKDNLVNFSNFLNSTGRISLLHAPSLEREELVFLLLNLKKGIKTILTEIGRTRVKKPYTYYCTECSENITVENGSNAWCTFQNHEHIENAYANKKFYDVEMVSQEITDNNNGETPSLSNLPSTSGRDMINENNIDNGMEPVKNDIYDKNDVKIIELAAEEFYKKGDNSFRFNFPICYDAAIEAKLYPESFVTAIRKCDRINYYTILRAGNYRAFCLLCCCELISRTKITKAFVLDHVMGQRHLRFAIDRPSVLALISFHETWLNLEPVLQAHQLFFKPENDTTLKCLLCNGYVLIKFLATHLISDCHRKKVVELYEKNHKLFFLGELHIQLYGPEVVAAAEKNRELEEQKKNEKENKKPREKTESESSPSSGKMINNYWF